jgi:DNA-binding IclR family transcriptional regulator
MKLSNGRLITLHVGDGAFRLLGRRHTVPVLNFLADAEDGNSLNEIDYGVVKSHASATLIMIALQKEGWVSRDPAKRYHLTDEGRAALELANSKEARVLLAPEERKGRV